MISTTRGLVPIESVLPGMRVWCKDKKGRRVARNIIRSIKKPLCKTLVCVAHSLGSFRCTEDHKIWTANRGYVKASDLTRDDTLLWDDGESELRQLSLDFPSQPAIYEEVLYIRLQRAPQVHTGVRNTELCSLRSRIQSGQESSQPFLREELLGQMAHVTAGGGRGFAKVSKRDGGKSTRYIAARCQGADASSEPYAHGGRKTKSERSAARSPISDSTGREWSNNSAARYVSKILEFRYGVCHSDTSCTRDVREVADLVQSRFGASGVKVSPRSRWGNTPHSGRQAEGRKKRRGFGSARVESVARVEPASLEQSPFGNSTDSFVYDLEVEDVHNYIADGIVVSNCHFAKNEDAMRSRYLRALADRCPHVILLSGTPLINSASELEAIKSIFNQDDGPMIRRLLEDVVPEVPPKTRATLPIVLRPNDEREYRRAENDFAEWLERELGRRMDAGEAAETANRALAAEALVKSGYLRRLLGSAKVHAAIDWIGRAARLGEPVVVFCEHQEVVEAVQKHLKTQRIGFVTIDGSVSRNDRQEAIDQFQAGKVPVFIGSKAAKEGITLTRARHLLFLERYWTSAEEEQAEDRIRRIGQTRPTTIWFLHATGTIDDRISQIIELKRRLIAHTIGASTINEEDESAVESLIAQWSERTASPFAGKETDLGHGKAFPPIPFPNTVLALHFRGPKWTEKRARSWAILHGYPVQKITPAGKGLRLYVASPASFESGKFTTLPIAADIEAVSGKRKRSTRSHR